MIKYYRARWPDEQVPPGEPTWMLYEVHLDKDNVLRDVEIFDNGAIARNSVEIEARDGSRFETLWDCSFLEVLGEVPFTEITQEEFESHWIQGQDTPFWLPAPNDQIPPRS